VNDTLGDRMKTYEDVTRHHLPRRLPVILRLDGKAFHTWTRGLERPYSQSLMTATDDVTKALCKEIQGVVMAYTQSDEISLLLVDYAGIETQSWFDSNLQKMVSVAAGMASAKLTALSTRLHVGGREAVFDARAFVLPPHEVNNYFIWRQADCTRNSMAMLAQSLYSPRQLNGKGFIEQGRMCAASGSNWFDLSSHIRLGRVATKRKVLKEVHIHREHTEDTMGLNIDQVVERSEWHVLEETPVFLGNAKFVEDLALVRR